MSTRSTTHFVSGDKTEAIVYRHADGYPEGHGVELQRFFSDVEAQTRDTRFSDPSYLAAKLVVWLAREFASSYEFEGNELKQISHANERPLDFISVGIVSEDPWDIEYRYVVDCSLHNADGRPQVTCYSTPIGGTEPYHQVLIPAPEEVES